MDLDDVRTIIETAGTDVWALIDAAIGLAAVDYWKELKDRRDGIVERLYSNSSSYNQDRIELKPPVVKVKAEDGEYSGGGSPKREVGGADSPYTPQSVHRDDDEIVEEDDDEGADPYGGLFDDEQSKILRIKEELEDPNQSEDALVDLLQSLADMDLTFKTLKETDIGRNVNRLRKHPSNEVKGLVKQLVRKWKDLVDEWVGSKHTEDAPIIRSDADSPLLQNIPRNRQNGLVPEFAYSPNPHNGSSGSDRNNSEPEQKPKAPVPKRETPLSRPPQSLPASASAPPLNRPQKESSIDLDRLASARRRLHENYQEANNAKKQRTIQVMGIHEIPKPKNGFIAKNKGGFQGRHHR